MSQQLGRDGRPIITHGLAYLQPHFQQQQQQQQAPPQPPTAPPPAPPQQRAGGITGRDLLTISRPDRRSRPDSDKVFEIEEYLSSLPGHRMADASEIYENLGLDLRPGIGGEEGVIKLLEAHPKIQVLPTPGQYQYVSKYSIRDRAQLRGWLERKYRNGLRQSDVKDCYPGIVDDLRSMVRAGEVLAIKDDKDMVVFARGAPFLVALSGGVQLKGDGDDDDDDDGAPSTTILHMTKDLRSEIRRGEAIRVGADQWARVSTAEDRRIQRLRAEPPLTVSIGAGKESWPPEDLRNEIDHPTSSSKAPQVTYREGFNPEEGLPLATALYDVHAGGGRGGGGRRSIMVAVRHGCTADVKDLLWARTREKVPKEEAELKKRLEEAALGAHASAAPKRPRMTTALSKQMQRKRKKEEAEERWRQELKAKAALVQEQQERAAARAAAQQKRQELLKQRREQQEGGGGGGGEG